MLQVSSGATVTVTASMSTAGAKLMTAPATATTANLRMSGINLAHIGGKPVLLASKPQSLQTQVSFY